MTRALEAARRLLTSLPVRVHRAGGPESTRIPEKKAKAPLNPGAGRGGCNRVRIEHNGRRYNSIREMAETLHVSNTTIYTMLTTGEARRSD